MIGPDSDYSVRNVIGIAKANPELAQKVVSMRYKAKMILEKFAGKAIHPVAGVVGGFAKPMGEEDRQEILKQMQEILDFACLPLILPKKRYISKISRCNPECWGYKHRLYWNCRSRRGT